MTARCAIKGLEENLCFRVSAFGFDALDNGRELAQLSFAPYRDGGVISLGPIEKTVKSPDRDGGIQPLHRIGPKSLIKLPWRAVGVQLLGPVSADEPRVVYKSDVTAKAVVCHRIISSMYPQWVVIYFFFKNTARV